MPPEPKTGPDPGQDPAGDPLAERVGKLEAGQDTLSGKIDQVLGLLGGGTPDDPEQPGTEPDDRGSIAAEIRRQLQQQQAADKESADRQTLADRLGAVETSLTEMREQPPGPLPRRSTRAMWGRE